MFEKRNCYSIVKTRCSNINEYDMWQKEDVLEKSHVLRFPILSNFVATDFGQKGCFVLSER